MLRITLIKDYSKEQGRKTLKKFFYEQGEENKREEREKENYIKEKGKGE